MYFEVIRTTKQIMTNTFIVLILQEVVTCTKQKSVLHNS